MRNTKPRANSGFTIVELLIVVIVIGILASLLFVSFTGLNQRAIVASIKTDLSTAAKQLKLFSIENGSYPATISTDCATSPDTSTNKCIVPSSGNSYGLPSDPDYPYTSTSSTFSLTEVNGNNVWRVTDSMAPGEVAPLTAISAITGTVAIGQTMTAGSLTPSGATATYQWQSAATSDGTYGNIAGATSNTYTAVAGDVNRFIKVSATGSNFNYNTVTSAATVAIDPWYAGQAETGYPTALIGKSVYYRDVNNTDGPAYSNTVPWQGNYNSCASPQCSTTVAPAPDPNYPTKMVLVDPIANSSVDFAAYPGYPAQNTCKALGGRLPMMNELLAIMAGKTHYGGNFQGYSTSMYWSATENGTNAYGYQLDWQMAGYESKTNGNYIRCVKS